MVEPGSGGADAGAAGAGAAKSGMSTGLKVALVVGVVLLCGCCLLGILSALVMPALMKAREQAFKVECANNLRQIAIASQLYADRHRGIYPWPLPGAPDPSVEITTEAQARDALALLYRYDVVDDPRVFVCRGSPDQPAEPIGDPAARRAQFSLDDHECSYTWRRRPVTSAASNTPLSGDRRRDAPPPNHRSGRQVVYAGGLVEWMADEALEGPAGGQWSRVNELLGYERR